MALNPALREIVARAADRDRRVMRQREMAREALVGAVADEIYSATPDDTDLDTLALADMIVERLENMGIDLPKPRISIRAATQHAA